MILKFAAKVKRQFLVIAHISCGEAKAAAAKAPAQLVEDPLRPAQCVEVRSWSLTNYCSFAFLWFMRNFRGESRHIWYFDALPATIYGG